MRERSTAMGGNDNLSPGHGACPIGAAKGMQMRGNAKHLIADVPRHPGHSRGSTEPPESPLYSLISCIPRGCAHKCWGTGGREHWAHLSSS